MCNGHTKQFDGIELYRGMPGLQRLVATESELPRQQRLSWRKKLVSGDLSESRLTGRRRR